MARTRALLKLFSLFVLFFSLVVVNASLLYTDNKSIFFLDEQSFFTRNKRPNTSLVYTNLTNSYTIDFDYSEQLIFWSDQSEDVIHSLRLSDKKSFAIVISNPQSPERFAVDWVGKKLYWADTGLNRIEVSNYNGSQRSVLISKDLESLWSITLVPEDGFLFWADCVPPGKIERSSMDGDPSSRTVIIEDRENCFSGLTVDYTAKRLYWFTIPVKNDLTHISRIESSDFFGNQRRSHLCSSARFPSPFRLFMTLNGETIYWSDNSSKDIHSCNLKTGAVSHANLPKYRSNKKDDQHVPHGLKWFSAAAQPGNHSHCSHNNGNCSHLCLLSSIGPRFISCACPIGMKLRADNQTCAVHEKLLLIARSSDLRKIALDAPDSSTIVLRKTKHATLIDYDPVEMMVYWADDHPDEKAIRKAPFNVRSSNDSVAVIKSEVDCLEAIVIDPVARNIYWTECDMARVVVARLDGSFRKVLVEEDLEKPRALAVHQEAGLMFWSDWGKKPKIERALLDGSERVAIVTTKIHWPNGLAIDHKESKLYFGDGMFHTVEFCRFDGSQRTLLIKDKAMYIFGFTLLDDWIYFSDRQKRLIKGINIHNSSLQRDLVDGISNQLPDWMGIKAVNFTTTENLALQNPCGTLNGRCSHFCFSRPDKEYTCACPRGYHLIDKFNCILDEVTYFLLQKHEIQQIANSSLISHVSGIQSAKSFDLDNARNTLYWIDSKFRAIFRLTLHKSKPEQIFKLPSDSNSKPEDLAIDWLSEQLYWVDSASRKIEVGKSNGNYRKVIYQFPEGQKPKSVVVDPVFGQLFVSSVDRQWIARIDCFYLDGIKPFKSSVIHNARSVHLLTIDYDDHRLYWLDENRNIDSCKYDGSNRKFIKGNSERFSGLSVFQNYIYLLDSSQKMIRTINKTRGFNITSANMTISVPSNTSDIIVSHQLAQTGWNCCANRNGGCEQLCFYKPKWKNGIKQYDTCDIEEDSSVVCGCKVNYRLDERDKRKCLGPDSFLLYSHKSTLTTRFLFDYKSVDFSETENFFLPSNVTNIQAISYDPYEEQLYFIDSGSSIQRKRFNDTVAKTIIQKKRTEEFYDLVIDPYSRILYWTSGATGRSSSINATRLIGEPTTIGTIYWNSGDNPKLLAMHYRKNILFWTNDQPKFDQPSFSGQTYQISRISLNPLPVSKVIIWKTEPIIAITVEQDLEFLVFSSVSEILYSDLEGKSIYSLFKEETAFNPFSMAAHSKYLFWLTAENGHHDVSIDKIPLDLNLGRPHQRVYEKIGELTKLISVTPMKKSFANLKCADENGGCSHICLIVEGIDGTEAQCACPLNLLLSGKNCTEPVTCPADQFRCLDGLRCTSDINRRCDGTATDNLSDRTTFDLPPVPNRSSPNYIWAMVCAIFIFILVIFIIICQFKSYQKDPEKLTTTERRAYYVPDQLHLTQLPEESSLFPAATAPNLVGYHIDGPSHENLSIVYPTATTNPPPSPATLRSQSIYSTTNSRAPVYPLPNRKPRKQRPKKSIKTRSDLTSISGTGRTGPPPSLCGSDYDYLSPTTSTSVKYEHLYENEHHLGTVYIPPAPTPRHYFSDPSCPPSPGTERSFCTVQNLVPPHPSPVPEDDF